jgi:hypothetical protein
MNQSLHRDRNGHTCSANRPESDPGDPLAHAHSMPILFRYV